MKRRDFLKVAGTAPFLSGSFGSTPLFGWIPGHYSQENPFRNVGRHLYKFGSGKVACLWKPYATVTGRPWLAHHQEGPDCVAQASGSCMDILTTIQIALKKIKERWITKSSTDMIYSGGRNIIGKGQLGRGGGMNGEWAVKYLQDYGNLLRQPYPPYDLTPYSAETNRYWDRQGVPESLLEIAKEHPLLEYAPVHSYVEVRDSVAAGYPIVFCASIGMNNSHRDNEGFCKPNGVWYHAWMIMGVDDEFHRPGVLLMNSHGVGFGSGPTRHDQPPGSIWLDAKYVDYQCKHFGDSYALSLLKGYPKPEEDYILW